MRPDAGCRRRASLTSLATPTSTRWRPVTLDAANIPRIGLLSGSAEEYARQDHYDLTTGSILLLGGMVVQLIKHGCKKVSMITVDRPRAGQLPALLNPFATSAGGSIVELHRGPRHGDGLHAVPDPG